MAILIYLIQIDANDSFFLSGFKNKKNVRFKKNLHIMYVWFVDNGQWDILRKRIDTQLHFILRIARFSVFVVFFYYEEGLPFLY